MITAKNITDDQIRELRSALFDRGHVDMVYLDDCYTALAIVGGPYWWRTEAPSDIVTAEEHRAARARCAEILNARAASKETK